jgi:hypothetical protein
MKEANRMRAERARTALEHYETMCLHAQNPITTDEEIIDLITDIFHFCEREKIDIVPVIHMARNNYNTESGKAI